MLIIILFSSYKKNLLTQKFINSKFALRFLTGLIAGGTEAAYDLTSYLLGKLLSIF